MKLFKSEKFQKIFYPIFYILFTIAITISGCFIFSRFYYTNIFVSGPSMLPTLVGYNDSSKNVHHYGIADTTNQAISSLKRFDVVITYYPKSWTDSTDLIVKRVWGFPGETIQLISTDDTSTFVVTTDSNRKEYVGVKNNEYQANIITTIETMKVYEFNVGNKIFRTRVDSAATQRNFGPITLEENQYFVMGDNWVASADCFTYRTHAERLERKHLQGKVICIQGYGKITGSSDNYKILNKHPIQPMYRF